MRVDGTPAVLNLSDHERLALDRNLGLVRHSDNLTVTFVEAVVVGIRLVRNIEPDPINDGESTFHPSFPSDSIRPIASLFSTLCPLGERVQ